MLTESGKRVISTIAWCIDHGGASEEVEPRDRGGESHQCGQLEHLHGRGR